MPAKRSVFRRGTACLDPAADQPADLVDAARDELVAALVQVVQLPGQPEEEARLRERQVDPAQQRLGLRRVRRLDESFENVERGAFDPVAEQEALSAWKLLEYRHKPDQKLVAFFERRPTGAGARRIPIHLPPQG